MSPHGVVATSRARRVLLPALLVVVVAAWVGWRFQTSADITHLLPDARAKRQAAVARALADSPVSRTLVVVLQHTDAARARAAAQRLAAMLRRDAEVGWVRSGPGEGIGREVYDAVFPARLGLLAADPERDLPPRLTDAGLEKAVATLKRRLALPTGALIKRVAPADPLLAFPAWLERLEAQNDGQLEVIDGTFMAQGRAVLFAGTRHSAMDYTHARPLLTRLSEALAQLEAETAVTAQVSGVHRHAVAARERIERDIQRISVVSSVAIVALFLTLFRGFSALILGLVPLAVGVLAGVATTLAVSGQVHGLTLTFGAALVGVCLDYPVHLLHHHHLHGGRSRAVWPGLLLGAGTTCVGFAGLAASSLPAVREVALFAIVGVTAALWATWAVVAPLLPRVPSPTQPQRWLARALSRLARPRGERLAWAPLVAAALVAVVGGAHVTWQDDVKALTHQDPALVAEDTAVRELVAADEPGRLVVVRGRDLEQALQRNDEVARRLAQQRAAGAVGGYRTLHTVLWSAELQRRNVAVLQASPDLPARLEAALRRAGFHAQLFAPFRQALLQPAPPLTWARLKATPLRDLLRPFFLHGAPAATASVSAAASPADATSTTRASVSAGGDSVALVTYLRDVRRPQVLARVVGAVPGASYFDQRAFLAETFGGHRQSAALLVLFGLLAVVLMVALRYRTPRMVAQAAGPAVLSAGATLGLLSLLGVRLHLLHLTSVVLVLSMGVDYGVFLAECRRQGQPAGATLLSIAVACASTVLGFGLLGLSSNPALRAIGLTTGVGVLLSLALSVALSRAFAPSPPEEPDGSAS